MAAAGLLTEGRRRRGALHGTGGQQFPGVFGGQVFRGVGPLLQDAHGVGLQVDDAHGAERVQAGQDPGFPEFLVADSASEILGGSFVKSQLRRRG